MINMNYLILITDLVIFLLVIVITIYNILFAFYSEKARQELVISLPSFLKKLLFLNVFLAFLTSLFIFYQILRNL